MFLSWVSASVGLEPCRLYSNKPASLLRKQTQEKHINITALIQSQIEEYKEERVCTEHYN